MANDNLFKRIWYSEPLTIIAMFRAGIYAWALFHSWTPEQIAITVAILEPVSLVAGRQNVLSPSTVHDAGQHVSDIVDTANANNAMKKEQEK